MEDPDEGDIPMDQDQDMVDEENQSMQDVEDDEMAEFAKYGAKALYFAKFHVSKIQMQQKYRWKMTWGKKPKARKS